MPQVDVQWPSEDEDFDAKASTSSSKTAIKAKPSISKAVDRPEVQQADEQSEPAVPEVPAEEAAEADTAAEAQQEPDPEQAPQVPADEAPMPEAAEAAPMVTTEQADQPDPDPAVENEAAALAAHVDDQPPAVSQVPVAKSRGSRMPKFNMKLWRLVGEGLLMVAVIGLGIWSWSLYNDRKDLQSQVNNLNDNPQSVVQKQTQQLITRVGALMQLPSGETPTVAEVSNASQAKQQSSFFNKAQNGDRVLMYVKAGEAILYRPSTNKIILVAPLVFTNSGSSSNSSSSTNKSATSTTGTTTPATTTTNK